MRQHTVPEGEDNLMRGAFWRFTDTAFQRVASECHLVLPTPLDQGQQQMNVLKYGNPDGEFRFYLLDSFGAGGSLERVKVPGPYGPTLPPGRRVTVTSKARTAHPCGP